MGTDKKDEWDELEQAEPTPGISPEIARALLNTNPALREGGMTTDLMIKQRNAATPVANKPMAAAKSSASSSLADTAKLLEKGLADAQARFNADKKALLDQLTSWLSINDPELRSPFTQQVLEQKKALLASLGFDVKAYVASRMKK